MNNLPVLGAENKAQLLRQILDRSDGMFLYASLAMQELRTATSPTDLIEGMLRIPPGLNDLYKSFVGDLQNHTTRQRSLARSLFSRVLCSPRPLRWNELQCSLSFTISPVSGLPGFDQEKRPYNSAVLCLCTPFIEYNPENDTFRPAHTSVYEFFDKEDDFQGASDLGICLRTAHREGASICLTYLGTFGLRTTVKNDTNLYPLVQYATKYWCHHLLMAQLDSDICSDALRFLRFAPERRCWLERWLMMERDVFPLQQLMQLIKQVRDRLQVITGDQQPDGFDYLQDILEILNGWDEYRLQQKSYDPAEQPAETQKLGIFERLVFVRELVREYTASSRLDDGVAQFQRAKCRLEQRPEVNPRDYRWLLNGLGLLYDQQQKTELALEVQKEALAIQLAAPFPNEFDMSLTTSELGRLHRHLGQYGESEKMHLQALKYLRSMFQETEPQIM